MKIVNFYTKLLHKVIKVFLLKHVNTLPMKDEHANVDILFSPITPYCLSSSVPSKTLRKSKQMSLPGKDLQGVNSLQELLFKSI